MTVSFFKYVLHHDIPAYETLGWKDLKTLVDTHHGFYAELMQWTGAGEPVMPGSSSMTRKSIQTPEVKG